MRNTLKHVSYKDRKEFANDLKTIYQAPSEQTALKNLEKVTEKWKNISRFYEKLDKKLGCNKSNI